MADVRCPMCGKSNPADLMECQHCHARLRPIWDSGAAIGQPEPSDDQSDDLPEWLKSLRLPQEQQPPVSEPGPEDRSNLPDWLSDLREQPVEPGYLQSDEIANNHVDSSDDETSDWLQSFLTEDGLTEAEDETVSGLASDASLQEEASWLSRIGSTPIEDQPLPESAEPLNWLSQPEIITPDETPSGEMGEYPPEDMQSSESLEDLPDWLFQSEPDTSVLQEQEPEQLADEPQIDATPEPLDEPEPAEEEELPAWLFVAAADEKTAEAPGEADSIGIEISELPLPPLPPAEETAILLEEEPAPEEAGLEGLVAEIPPETLPEEAEKPADGAAPFLVAAGAAAIGHGLDLGEELPEEDLGWLDELETVYGGLTTNVSEETASTEGAEAGLESISSLPEWLTRGPVDEAPVLEEVEEDEGELKPAEVPSWLQAMRPVGVTAAAASVLGDAESQQIEGAGPLAGLRGALPAEPEVSKAQKPPVYSVKLQVSDAQQLQAELLRGLIDSEGVSPVLPERSAIGSQKVIRLLIAILLIVPLLFVLLTGIPQLSLPVLPLEVDAVGKVIDGLQPGAPVLLAVDYQPGFSGEMDTITVPVLQHLFDRGAFPAAVSTIATGPAQAEHLFSQVRVSSGAPLQANTDYANLGYIPGGATGLLAFAQSPRDTLPTNLRGERVWDTPPLQPADMLEKFALVVVATDNPDTARYWIEQVQPYIGATPFVMVLSAQAEPVVRPYYEANPPKVQGLVGGLAGGAAYLGRSAMSGAATRFWSPYGAGALVAVVLMILAGLANLISAQVSRRREMTLGGKGS